MSAEQDSTVGSTRRDVVVAAGIAVAGSTLVPTTAYSYATRAATPNDAARSGSVVMTADGIGIFYKGWGPKDAQPLVFHHGWDRVPGSGV